MTSSLRTNLLAWVLMPLIGAVAVDTWLTFRSAENTATVIQDRMLLGSARMIAEQISFEDGAFQHQIPPAALELFQSREPDSIFYRVTTGTGQLLSGYSDLPVPKIDFPSDSSLFFDSTMRDQPVRIVAFLQPVVGNPSALPVTVEVAQTNNAHRQLTYGLWIHAVVQQLLILALVAVFILFGLHRGLKPILRLRDDVRAREEGTLQPLQTSRIPSELRPLVNAINDYIQRLERHTNRRSTFIQNAAHQLRTPLTVLNTQLSDAIRADNLHDRQECIVGARRTLHQTIRVVNQFLTLSSVEVAERPNVTLGLQEFSQVVQIVLEDLAALAHGKRIDLGFNKNGPDVSVKVDQMVLREIAVNLVDNAIRYTPPDGVVTVRVATTPNSIALLVEDNGPGVPVVYHEQLFQRFFRMHNAESTGSGLGLAIVKELSAQCGATVRLEIPSHGGSGLAVVVVFPRDSLSDSLISIASD